MENTLPQRKTPRASWIDYNEGEYFITICTKEKTHYFGEIVNDVMCFSPIGAFLDVQLKNVCTHHPHVQILAYTVMPNHVHAIVRIGSIEPSDAMHRIPTGEERMGNKVGSGSIEKGIRHLPLLSSFIGLLKAAVTRYARKNGIPFCWQSRYHDHTIRSVDERNHIAQYITNNVLNWSKDCFY